MKKYVRADAEHFTVESWREDPNPYPSDVDYIVIEDLSGNTFWEGNPRDIPDKYYSLDLFDEAYVGAGLCILTVVAYTEDNLKMYEALAESKYDTWAYLVSCNHPDKNKIAKAKAELDDALAKLEKVERYFGINTNSEGKI